MSKDPPAELIAFLGRFSPEVVETMLATRGMVFELVSDVTENVLSVSYTVSCGYTFTHSIKQAFLYVAAFKAHVNVGFVDGSGLSDPSQILEGDGKSMRHIKIRRVSDLENPAIAALIREAAAQAFHPEAPLAPITMVSPKPNKRR